MLTFLIENHILAQPDTRPYAMLARTCKEARELLGDRPRVDKWKLFQPKFSLQLDFFDMFRRNYGMGRTDFIVFAIRRTYLTARIRRHWDFVREAMTVIVRVESCRLVEDNAKWEGWEFAYTYDAAQSLGDNLVQIHTRLHAEARAAE